MAKNRSSGARSNSGAPSSGASSSSTRGVSPARLQQKSGAGSAFGGYMKVNHGNGTFSMRRSGK